MATKKTNDLPVAHVGDVPDHKLALVGQDQPDSLQTMRHHRVLNRLAVIQSNSPREKKEKFEEASIAIPAVDLKVCSKDESVLVVPVMFFDEFIQWGDRKDKTGPMIREKTVNLTSKLAAACDDPQRWRVKYGDNQQFEARNNHHLNFLVVIYSGPLKGTLAVASFARSEYKKGTAWMANIQQRRINGRQAPLWSQVWEFKVGPRKNEHGEWYGIDFANPSTASPWIEGQEIEAMRAMHEQLLVDYKAQILDVGHKEAEVASGSGEPTPAGETEY